MRLFSKEAPDGRPYSELQKKTKERMAANKQAGGAHREPQAAEAKLIQEVAELRRLVEQMDMEKLQEDMEFLKQKQDYVLRNFPILESNMAEKAKGALAGQMKELLGQIERIEEKQRRQNIWTKVLLWFSLAFSFLSAGGVLWLLIGN